jgi:hypothetical protein
MEHVLQKNAKVGHISNLEWLQHPKINLKAMTFHNEEQNELEDVTKNTKSETVWPIENHPPKLICDLAENDFFWYHEIILKSPYAKKNEIDWLQRRIDELHRFQGKELFDEVQSV